MKHLMITSMLLVPSALSVVATVPAWGQGAQPTYPCIELAEASTCARFPYRHPIVSSDTQGTQIACELVGPTFTSQATQRQVRQLSCIYGQCNEVGYGLYWYQTLRKLSNADAPRILLSTSAFAPDPLTLDDQLITVGFNASQAFFDGPTAVLNAEIDRLSAETVVATVSELRRGVKRTVTIGVLDSAGEVTYSDVLLTCTAGR